MSITLPEPFPRTFAEILMKTFFVRLFAAVLTLALVLPMSGCCRKKAGEVPGTKRSSSDSAAGKQSESNKQGDSVGARPTDLLEKTGLNYSIDTRPGARKPGEKAGSFFEKQYLEGVQMMEKGEFTQAINVFDELIKRYPNSEEASIAELCIAELYFRSKANDLALKAYERIIEKYPNTHAAENARSGIDYLQNIQRYEEEYISPDVEARKRRGY